MKELIEGLLFVALLKFIGVPMWLISLGSVLFLIGFFVYISLQSADSRRGHENSRLLLLVKNNKPNVKKPNVVDKKQSPTQSGMQGLYSRD